MYINYIFLLKISKSKKNDLKFEPEQFNTFVYEVFLNFWIKDIYLIQKKIDEGYRIFIRFR